MNETMVELVKELVAQQGSHCHSQSRGESMTRDDMNRWEAEIDSWRQRYEALLKTVADNRSLAPPMMLADKQSYELGLLHGAAAEREACANLCDRVGYDHEDEQGAVLAFDLAIAIRARGNT